MSVAAIAHSLPIGHIQSKLWMFLPWLYVVSFQSRFWKMAVSTDSVGGRNYGFNPRGASRSLGGMVWRANSSINGIHTHPLAFGEFLKFNKTTETTQRVPMIYGAICFMERKATTTTVSACSTPSLSRRGRFVTGPAKGALLDPERSFGAQCLYSLPKGFPIRRCAKFCPLTLFATSVSAAIPVFQFRKIVEREACTTDNAQPYRSVSINVQRPALSTAKLNPRVSHYISAITAHHASLAFQNFSAMCGKLGMALLALSGIGNSVPPYSTHSYIITQKVEEV